MRDAFAIVATRLLDNYIRSLANFASQIGDDELGLQYTNTFAAAIVWCWVVTSGIASGEWQNSLKPTGPPGSEIVLVKDRKSVRPILLAPNATTIEKNAAAELQHWIEQITTARPEITTANRGSSVRLRTEASLGEEGYRIAMEGDDLVLTGGTGRGVVNAVYALLEEDVGCRFYTSDSIKLPKESTLAIRPVARSYVPKLKLRDPFYQVAFDSAWSLRNRTNAPHAVVSEEFGGRIDYDGLFVHSTRSRRIRTRRSSAFPRTTALGIRFVIAIAAEKFARRKAAKLVVNLYW